MPKCRTCCTGLIFFRRADSTATSAWRPNLPDEADNHLVELALAGAADYIVTRNLRDLRDLARMELRFPGLQVMSPENFLKELK